MYIVNISNALFGLCMSGHVKKTSLQLKSMTSDANIDYNSPNNYDMHNRNLNIQFY